MCDILCLDDLCSYCGSPHENDVEHDVGCVYIGGETPCTVFTEVSYTTYPCDCANDLFPC